jgi:hypothetical protein
VKLFLTIELTDEMGRVHGRLRQEVHESAAFIGERIVDEMRAGVLSGPDDPFAAVVEVMRTKEFRRSLLKDAARNIGHALADHLEDREGWHGIERAERVRELYDGKRCPICRLPSGAHFQTCPHKMNPAIPHGA